MKIRLLTIASVTIFVITVSQLTRAHRTNPNSLHTANKVVQSTSKKAPESKSVSTEQARMGMYNAVMSALSAGSGLTTRAREHAEKAIALLKSPRTDIEFYAKGIAFTQLDNYDLAIASFNKAIALNPQREISYLSRGRAHSQKENYDRAIVDFNKAIKLWSNLTKSDSKEEKDDPNETDKNEPYDVHKDIQADPEPWFYWFTRGEPYHDRGKAYLKKEDYDRAIADFNTLIELEPNRAKGYLDRGTAYALKDDLDRAIVDFTKAIQLNPRLKNAHYNRGLAYKLKGDQDRARADFDREAQLYPETPDNDAPSNADDNKESLPVRVVKNLTRSMTRPGLCCSCKSFPDRHLSRLYLAQETHS